MQLEYPVYFGREVKRADIVIMDEDRPTVPYIIVEVKKPKLKDGKEQLKSYCNSTGAPIAVWSNGEQIAYYNRKDPNYFEDIRDIPKATQTLMDVISERWTIEDLKANDVLQKDKISLKEKLRRWKMKSLQTQVLTYLRSASNLFLPSSMTSLWVDKIKIGILSLRMPEEPSLN